MFSESDELAGKLLLAAGHLAVKATAPVAKRLFCERAEKRLNDARIRYLPQSAQPSTPDDLEAPLPPLYPPSFLDVDPRYVPHNTQIAPASSEPDFEYEGPPTPQENLFSGADKLFLASAKNAGALYYDNRKDVTSDNPASGFATREPKASSAPTMTTSPLVTSGLNINSLRPSISDPGTPTTNPFYTHSAGSLSPRPPATPSPRTPDK